jgi:RNA polymerase sigma-70 factor, ECF subfamily
MHGNRRVTIRVAPMTAEVNQPPVSSGLAEVLERITEAGRRDWPTIVVPVERLREQLFATTAGTAPQGALEVAALHAGDLYLAWACLLGDAGAIRALDGQLRVTVPLAVRRIDPSPAFADEVRQRLAQRLLVAEGGDRPRLATYAGRGPLAAWLAVAAQRVAIDLSRQVRREVPLPENFQESFEDDFALALSRVGGPEEQLWKQQYGAVVQEGLRRGLRALTARDRTILRMNLVAGVSLETIGKSYRVNQSTVTRWIARAREQILTVLQAHLAAQVAVSELPSLVRLVRSQVDVAMSESGLWSGPSGDPTRAG